MTQQDSGGRLVQQAPAGGSWVALLPGDAEPEAVALFKRLDAGELEWWSRGKGDAVIVKRVGRKWVVLEEFALGHDALQTAPGGYV